MERERLFEPSPHRDQIDHWKEYRGTAPNCQRKLLRAYLAHPVCRGTPVRVPGSELTRLEAAATLGKKVPATCPCLHDLGSDCFRIRCLVSGLPYVEIKVSCRKLREETMESNTGLLLITAVPFWEINSRRAGLPAGLRSHPPQLEPLWSYGIGHLAVCANERIP